MSEGIVKAMSDLTSNVSFGGGGGGGGNGGISRSKSKTSTVSHYAQVAFCGANAGGVGGLAGAGATALTKSPNVGLAVAGGVGGVTYEACMSL
jgi:hypothetical protein